jgi:hypothetical protein
MIVSMRTFICPASFLGEVRFGHLMFAAIASLQASEPRHRIRDEGVDEVAEVQPCHDEREGQER